MRAVFTSFRAALWSGADRTKLPSAVHRPNCLDDLSLAEPRAHFTDDEYELTVEPSVGDAVCRRRTGVPIEPGLRTIHCFEELVATNPSLWWHSPQEYPPGRQFRGDGLRLLLWLQLTQQVAQ